MVIGKYKEILVELPDGSVLDEFIEGYNLSQLIDEPTNIQTTGMSCIDLVITDQPNLFVDFGVHPSLDNHCQQQKVHGKLNISVSIPPSYEQNVLYSVKAQKDKIKSVLENIDWPTSFAGLDVDDMTQLFTSKCINILSQYIPNKIITCDDRDSPWMTATLRSAIKNKHIISMLNMDGNQRIGNMCIPFTTRLLPKLSKPKMSTFLTWVKVYLIQ